MLHLLDWFIGSRSFSSLDRRPEFWVLHSQPQFSRLGKGLTIYLSHRVDVRHCSCLLCVLAVYIVLCILCILTVISKWGLIFILLIPKLKSKALSFFGFSGLLLLYPFFHSHCQRNSWRTVCGVAIKKNLGLIVLWRNFSLTGNNVVRASLMAQQLRICLQCRRHRLDPWVRKIPWRRKWQPTPVFFPGEFQG